jgi:hypothetical protein
LRPGEQAPELPLVEAALRSAQPTAAPAAIREQVSRESVQVAPEQRAARVILPAPVRPEMALTAQQQV